MIFDLASQSWRDVAIHLQGNGLPSTHGTPESATSFIHESVVLEEADRVEQLREIVNNIVGFYAFFFHHSLV
jgi:hypothetical protein